MKRIILILSVILFLSSPGRALWGPNNGGIPIELVVSDKAFSLLKTSLDETILNSSHYCLFNGQPLRVRIVIEITRQKTGEYFFSAEWFIRVDSESVKFIPKTGGSLTGYFSFGESDLAAMKIIDFTEELFFGEEEETEPTPEPEEYYDIEYEYDSETVEA
jgi:hypothetical protein